MADIAISIEGLTKAFGTNQVLQGITLQVPAGCTLALLGRNGAGKTTTLRILMGLIRADAGRVSIGAVDPAVDPSAVRRQVGYLAEDQAMYPWMTAVELFRFLAPFYPTWDHSWAIDILDRFAIPRHTRIRRLSKGQSVKLGLAVALAHHPPIVVLDDPAMGLDPIARKEFNRELIEHLQVQGCTVLYSSHLLDEVEAVADQIAILDHGRVIRCTDTMELKDDVKQIILSADSIHGPAPNNLLDLRRHDDRWVMVVDQAQDYLQRLRDDAIEHQVNDLSLDEIFESYVIGRKTDWPTGNIADRVTV